MNKRICTVFIAIFIGTFMPNIMILCSLLPSQSAFPCKQCFEPEFSASKQSAAIIEDWNVELCLYCAHCIVYNLF